MKKYLSRLKNPMTIASLVSFIVVILVNFGIKVNTDQLTNILNAVCGIGIVLGIFNNPVGTVKVTTDITKALENAEDEEAAMTETESEDK